MARRGRVRVGVVGLGFGKEFPAIHQAHPLVEWVAICDTGHDRLRSVATQTGIDRTYTDYREMLRNPDIDAVHIVTGIPSHAELTIAALEAGKHCACTVPMATSIGDIRRIIKAVRRSGRLYMMMETAVYTREFLYAKELVAKGALGGLQLLRGAHYQDMEQWPSYWKGLPPMHYATHAVAPCLALVGTRAVETHCYGSGVMRSELRQQYGNPYPAETAIFRLEGCDAAMEITRSLFHVGRGYTEMFNVYGENGVFEWPQIEGQDKPALFEMQAYRLGSTRPTTCHRIDVPDYAFLLPEPIKRFTSSHEVVDKNHQSFVQGGGHGGSHPHMVHEFVSSVVEERKPWIDEITAANWTAAGICAHASAMRRGAKVRVPSFE